MKFEVTILGCGAALPTALRGHTAQLVNIQEQYFLVDCGEGSQMRLREEKISLQRINHIFISHLHGDHYYGLRGLLTSMSLLGRTKELSLYAPPTLQHLLEFEFKQTGVRLSFPLQFHRLEEPGLIYESSTVEVETFPLNHSVPCFGFLFREKEKPRKVDADAARELGVPVAYLNAAKQGKDYEQGETRVDHRLFTKDPEPSYTYAFCTDTTAGNHVEEYCSGVDCLYHEATFMHQDVKRAERTFHSTAIQAGQMAKSAQVKHLVLGHFSARYKDLDELLQEAQSEFDSVQLAYDGLVLRLY